ncbi:unnamed protein product, partial [marine sediment metagenome]
LGTGVGLSGTTLVSGTSADFTIAANDSLTVNKLTANAVCTGADDEVEINAAFATVGAGGRVVLLEGTFVIEGEIAFTTHNQTLEGQGYGTFLNGDAVIDGQNVIAVDTTNNCRIKNLRIQSADGGGNVVHCINVEGSSNGLLIENVTITDSDSDGIHIEDDTIYDVQIHDCHIENADDYGIFVDMNSGQYAYRIHIKDNTIVDTGNDGIHFGPTGAGSHYALVTDNVIATSGGDGIELRDAPYGIITGNTVVSSTGHGIIVPASNFVTVA